MKRIFQCGAVIMTAALEGNPPPPGELSYAYPPEETQPRKEDSHRYIYTLSLAVEWPEHRQELFQGLDIEVGRPDLDLGRVLFEWAMPALLTRAKKAGFSFLYADVLLACAFKDDRPGFDESRVYDVKEVTDAQVQGELG